MSVQGSLVPPAPLPLTTARVGAGTLVVFGDYQIAPIAARSTAMGRWRLTPPWYGGTCLPAGRSVRGSDTPPACHSTPRPSKGKALGGAPLSNTGPSRGRLIGVRRQERKISAVAEASGRVSLRAGERTRSPFDRQRRRKAMPARIRGKSQLSIAREGFLDRRSKRCFWLLLSPQTKVARAGARNYPRRRQRKRSRRGAKLSPSETNTTLAPLPLTAVRDRKSVV